MPSCDNTTVIITHLTSINDNENIDELDFEYDKIL